LTMDHKCNCATGVQPGATDGLHPPTPAGSTLGARRLDGTGTPHPSPHPLVAPLSKHHLALLMVDYNCFPHSKPPERLINSIAF